MTTIDEQNSRQIRQPMDVLITMSLADTDISMTYSGYSSAKVADGVLDERSWAMRKLADLQGDGFPLDGSCVLYNASTTPSQANGKLGVRSNVGQSVSVTATGSKVMASIGASVSGAESVTMNGVTTDITSSTVVLPLLDTSATLTFNPAYEDRRIEISAVLPEADFKITNDNLIRATVSLRSDLSIIEPTLPESEINIEAYFDVDVSEAVTSIPEDTPIVYLAGYEGDMSPERKFYVTGQVTWADNVLTIHAVDAVHFLEIPTPGVFRISSNVDLYRLLLKFLTDAGIETVYEDSRSRIAGMGDGGAIFERNTCRGVFSLVQWLFYAPEYDFMPVYVDAGRPSMYAYARSPKWMINESDCGDIKKNVEPKISNVKWDTFGWNDISLESYCEVGTWSWYKDNGAFLEINDYTMSFEVSFKNDAFSRGPWSSVGAYKVIPNSPNGYSNVFSFLLDRSGYDVAMLLFDSEVEQNKAPTSYVPGYYYTQVIPWDCYYNPSAGFFYYSQTALWNKWVEYGNFSSDQTNADGVLWGHTAQKPVIERNIPISAEGVTTTVQTNDIWGELGWDGEAIFPEETLKSQCEKSNITGSFSWKGDPRIQPRDVVEWERLDGTTETITLENITLTHEGGGTSAEITYRKGVI